MKHLFLCLFAYFIVISTYAQTQESILGKWSFERLYAFDAATTNESEAQDVADMFVAMQFSNKQMTFFLPEDETIIMDYVFQSPKLILSQANKKGTIKDKEEYAEYLRFLKSYQFTIDFVGKNDGKHFKLNFWDTHGKLSKPYFQLIFKK